MIDPNLPLDLGDGLLLRSVRPEETETLVAIKADEHRSLGATEPDAYIGRWARDLLTRPHPTFRPEWFLVVEDSATGQIVSSMCLIPQTWTYGGTPFPVGRVEMVSTAPEYRRRGLIRRQMEVVHRWSDELGHLAQVILGIPWYYRQFGYEYAVAFAGGRALEPDRVESLPEDATDPFTLRPATEADIPFLASVMEHGEGRYEVTCRRDEAHWRYELTGRSIGEQIMVVERTGAAEPVGLVVCESELSGGNLFVIAYELMPGVSWFEVTPSLLRGLHHKGTEIAANTSEPYVRIGFRLGQEHPVYRTHRSLELPRLGSYAWYLRVPDMLRFIRHITPVLEDRLAQSDLAGFSGELKLGFFKDGLHLTFTDGRLVEALPWREEEEGEADATFFPLAFLQVLFGRKTQRELEEVLPDCRVRTQRAELLIGTLFPRQPSLIWSVM